MIYHKCRVKHDPPNTYGDCLRASVASLLHVHNSEDVPHFAHDGDQSAVEDRMREYLRSRQMDMYLHAFGGLVTFDEIMKISAEINPGIAMLLFCNNCEGDHVIIVRDGKVQHDPSWLPSGKYLPLAQNGFWVIGVLTPIL